MKFTVTQKLQNQNDFEQSGGKHSQALKLVFIDYATIVWLCLKVARHTSNNFL